MGGTINYDAEDLESDPPASLTKRGLEMLEEHWVAAGRPPKPLPGDDDDARGWIGIKQLASHRGANARAAARIRAHLIRGGYLNLVIWKSDDQGVESGANGIIEELGLSAKAFDALGEAGIIPEPQT